jgi:hypothetical protein
LFVSKYGNSYVFKEIDTVKMKLLQKVKIITVSDDTTITLSPVKIHGLKGSFTTHADLKQIRSQEQADSNAKHENKTLPTNTPQGQVAK